MPATLTPVTKLTLKALGQYRNFKPSVERALKAAQANGCELFLSDAAYQVAKIVGPGVKLVIYPHRYTSGQGLRIRDEASADKAKALEVMKATGIGMHWRSATCCQRAAQ